MMFISNCRVLALIYIFMMFLSYEFPTLSWAKSKLTNGARLKATRCFEPHPNGRAGKNHSNCDLSDEATPARYGLSNKDFSGHNFKGANFTGQDLTNSNFSNANLKGANFEMAILSEVNFENSDLTGAIFKNADLSEVNLNGAILTGVDFTEAELTDIKLGNANVQSVKDLESYLAKNSNASKKQKQKQIELSPRLKKRLKKNIETYLVLYKKMNKVLERIENCCESDLKDDPSFKQFIANLKVGNKSKAREVHDKYTNTYFKYGGEQLADLSTRDAAIYDISLEQKEFHKLVNVLKMNNLSISLEKEGDRVVSRFHGALEKESRKRKNEADFLARKKAKQERIALIANTLIYKEMVAGFENGFLTNPINVMMMMQLKVAGKSDSELAELWASGINGYKSCMSEEVGKRFSKDQLKLMATEEGTNRLEVISIGVKCGNAASKTFLAVLNRQQ